MKPASSEMKALMTTSSNIGAAMLIVCDQPFISAELLNEMVTQYKLTRCEIVASAYGATIDVPALFSKTQFPAIVSLRGDQGAKQIMKGQENEILSIPFSAGVINIDTLDDYKQYCYCK